MSVTAKLLSLPEAAQLAALLAWREGLSSRDAVTRDLGEARVASQSSRGAAALRKAGIKTLADLTLRLPRRRRWWVDIDGLCAAGARQIEAFFAEHADLTDRARALLVTTAISELVSREKLVVPREVDGSMGLHRAPRVLRPAA